MGIRCCADEGQDSDLERTNILEGYGLKIIRFTNSQVLNHFDSVCEQIQHLIPPNPP
ncbi:endonuclease domain-containing protein [Nostoc sp.]|uniref:endonuclease domain-containing protein n=1 Tax=Nostoc sp. TaxID=1180 RepID=UPI003FA5AC9C